jgi:hypothetical protein
MMSGRSVTVSKDRSGVAVRRGSAILVATALVLVFAARHPLAARAATDSQIDAGYLAKVADLKTTVGYSTAEDRTDVALALVPPAPSGGPGITLIFRARFRGRSVDAARLEDIVLRAQYALHSDDRPRTAGALLNSPSLHLNLDPSDSNGIQLDYFPATWGYSGFSAPGDEIPVAFFAVTPAELRAMSIATVITGDALWTRFSLTAEEVEAIHEFARTVLPQAPPTN